MQKKAKTTSRLALRSKEVFMDVLKEKHQREKFTAAQVLRFLIPSAIGAFLFMCPIPDGTGSFIIPITIVNGSINQALSGVLPYIAMFIIFGSAVMTFLGSVCKLPFIENSSVLRGVFVTKWYWVILRALGALITFLVFFQIGLCGWLGRIPVSSYSIP